MSFAANLSYLSLIAFLAPSDLAFSSDVVSEQNGMEINWTRQKIKTKVDYQGLESETYSDKVRQAWKAGLTNFSESTQVLYREQMSSVANNAEDLALWARTAADKVSRSTYSRNTTYQSSGGVSVDLENSLNKALAVPPKWFADAGGSETDYSGLILKLPRRTEPFAIYKVASEKGEELFNLRQMNSDSYSKRLMARWLKKNSQTSQLTSFAGKKPKVVFIKKVDGNTLVIDTDEEEELSEALTLMRSGKVVIETP